MSGQVSRSRRIEPVPFVYRPEITLYIRIVQAKAIYSHKWGYLAKFSIYTQIGTKNIKKSSEL